MNPTHRYPTVSRAATVDDALADPSIYPHAPMRVERRETHASIVYLAGDRAYKLKKPVVFPFLDYGTPERRHEMCRAEVELNRRLAPHRYLGVRALVERDGRLALEPDGAPGALDHVVEMARYDEEQTLAARLEHGTAGEQEVCSVARRLDAFHRAAEPGSPPLGSAAALARRVFENQETLLRFSGAPLDAALVAGAGRFFAAFLSAAWDELALRERAGLVRVCHGDLRAEHVLLGDELEIVDCIEFSRELREIDVAADLAVLVMDLERLGGAELARAAFAAYRQAGGNPGPDRLLYGLAAYRAWVRSKVAALLWEELGADDPRRPRAADDARAYAALGERLAWRARGPLVLAVCGTAATGKSSLAAQLAAASGMPVVSSDRVRKEMAGLAASQRGRMELYSRQASLRTYEELGRRARALAGTGRGVLVDATMRRQAERMAFAAALGPQRPRVVYARCVAPASVVDARARTRARDPRRESDATEEVVRAQLGAWDPLDEVEAGDEITVRTDRPPALALDDLEALLDARLARTPIA
jgi:aminoglycoside phosphotransferase family enzyme/predicted kinase